MRTLYCLALNQGRKYVGETPVHRFSRRLEEHIRFAGAKWTHRFGFRKLLWKREVPDNEITQAENDATLKIMRAEGLNAVRGGDFVICRDVRRIPSWALKMYHEYAEEIYEAEARRLQRESGN